MTIEFVRVNKKTQPEWLAQAVRLEKKCFSKRDSLGQRLIDDAMRPHHTLLLAVYRQSAAIYGYVLFRRNGTEGHIDRIAVTEHNRRQGLGRCLLQAAIEFLQTNRALKLVLEADTTNLGAIALYESHGFRRRTIRANYYRPGHDALLMELKI